MKKKNIGYLAKREPGGAKQSVIINKVDVQPIARTEQDIPKWRRAIQSAESKIPRRVLLYNLYHDVDIDGHVEAVTGKRRDAVTAANWQFVDKDNKPIDEINDLIDTIGFNDILEEIVNTRFWGYTILEPRFYKDLNGKWQIEAGLLPRRHYRPELGKIVYQMSGDEGIDIRSGIYAKTVMEVGRTKDLGLYMKAAPYQILKRGGLGDYAAFIQTFATPIIDATWDGVTDADRLALKEALRDIGAGGTIIRPNGTEIDIIENRAKDTGDSHGTFLSFLNKELSKALLGTTETTESSQSSGHAQSKTHQDQDDDKHENDLNFVRRYLNSRFIGILNSHGFNTQGGTFIVQGEDSELSKKEMFGIHKEMKKMGIPISDDFFYETYDLPKPDNYDELKAANETKIEDKEDEDENNTKKTPVKEKPKKDDQAKSDEKEVRLTFWERLKSLFQSAPTQSEVSGAEQGCCGDDHIIKLSDTEDIDIDGVIRRVYEANGVADFDSQLYMATGEILIRAFKQGWESGRAKIDMEMFDGIRRDAMQRIKEAVENDPVNLAETGFTYGIDDPALLRAFEQNLFRFSSAKTVEQIEELNRLFRESTSFADFYEKATALLRVYNRNYLETEYNTAINIGGLAAKYHRLVANANIYPYWQYRTWEDERVRPAHAAMQEIILKWDDPLWDKLYPPNGWNCRCDISPRMPHEVDESKLSAYRRTAEAYLNSEQGAKEAETGWSINRAKMATVFDANNSYRRELDG